jgi:transposase
MSIHGAPAMTATVVAVDVGKNTAALSVTDAARHRLFGPVEFAMTAPAVAAVVERVCAVVPGAAVKVGVEAAGHYHRPLLGSGLWPAGWELVELSPARVSEQRRVQGRRRVKTDAIDLEAITELVLAGHGVPVRARAAGVTELAGWAMHRSRRVQTRTATKNQLLAQLDRCFPGLTLALPDVLGTRIGRLVAAEFADPHRLAALGVTRFVRFAANRGLRVRWFAAERLVAAARTALPAPEAVVARQVLADDLALLAYLDAQIAAAEAKMSAYYLICRSPYDLTCRSAS